MCMASFHQLITVTCAVCCLLKAVIGTTKEPVITFNRPLDKVDDSLVYFEVLEPSSIRYIYTGRPAKDFGTSFNQSYSSIELFVGEPIDGCSRLTNFQYIRGNGVLIERGGCSFLTKTLSAEHAGALFIIVYDDDPGSTNSRVDMVHDETDRKAHIPALLIPGKDGALIKNHLGNGEDQFAILNIPVNLTQVPYHKRNHPPWYLI